MADEMKRVTSDLKSLFEPFVERLGPLTGPPPTVPGVPESHRFHLVGNQPQLPPEQEPLLRRMIEEFESFYASHLLDLHGILTSTELRKCTLPLTSLRQSEPAIRRAALLADVLVLTSPVRGWYIEEGGYLYPDVDPSWDYQETICYKRGHGSQLGAGDLWTWHFLDPITIRDVIHQTTQFLDKMPVIYLPAFGSMGKVDLDSPYQEILGTASSLGASPIVETAIPLEPAVSGTHLLDLEIPFLDGVNLPDLATILHKERSGLLRFRDELAAVVHQVKQQLPDEQPVGPEVRSRLRRAVEELDGRLRTAAAHRTARMATIALGSFSLAAVAILGAELTTIVAGVAAVLGLLGRELADAYKEARVMDEDPYMLLWRLRDQIPDEAEDVEV